jgi:O-succinylbenzoic acid--CoA ligase
MIDHLILNGKKIYFRDFGNVDITSLSDFEKNTLNFCREWISGSNQFELQTSGSTGTPKKITATRGQMEASATMTLAALQLAPGQTSLICLDTRYIAGKMMLVRAMIGNLNIIAIEPVANPFENIRNEPVDFIALVPYQLKSILDSEHRNQFNQIKHVIIGGAPLDDSIKKLLQNYSCQFYETFGMTETLSHIALKRINGPGKSDYFKILPGIHIRQDERACLCIQAPHLSDEIVTNDVIEMKSLDEFIWLGRFDNVINSGGVKIFPEATEKKIVIIFDKLQITNRFLIKGLPDEKWGHTVALFIEGILTPEKQFGLELALKGALDKFEMPRQIRFMPAFAQTPTQKINRNATMDLFNGFHNK